MAGHKGSGHKGAAKGGAVNADPPAEKALLLSAALQVARPLAVRLLSISDRTFRRLESEGIIRAVKPGDGRRPSIYDAPAVVGAYLAHRERQLTGSNMSPRDRKDRSQAELNELRLARERREVLPRERVVAEGQAYIKASVAKIRTMPSRMVRAGLIPPASEPAVVEILREAMDEMSRWNDSLVPDASAESV